MLNVFWRVVVTIVIILIIYFSAGAITVQAMTQKDLLPGQSCRSQSVKKEFDRRNGYPKGRKGYVVDHICALGNGGLDIQENLQYQTLDESKKKDKIENTKKGRELFCTSENSLPYRTIFNCK